MIAVYIQIVCQGATKRDKNTIGLGDGTILGVDCMSNQKPLQPAENMGPRSKAMTYC